MCAKGIQNTHFAKGQKLTRVLAHTEKHAGQRTPLHYTQYSGAGLRRTHVQAYHP